MWDLIRNVGSLTRRSNILGDGIWRLFLGQGCAATIPTSWDFTTAMRGQAPLTSLCWDPMIGLHHIGAVLHLHIGDQETGFVSNSPCLILKKGSYGT
jgi:hypothetical protein